MLSDCGSVADVLVIGCLTHMNLTEIGVEPAVVAPPAEPIEEGVPAQ